MIPIKKLEDIAALVYRDFIEPLMNRVTELETENAKLREELNAQSTTDNGQVRDVSDHV